MDRQVRASSISAGAISASNAGFSENRQYRWWLHRQWTSGFGLLLFIGLNPSRADGERDDPTLRRLQAFAKSWGYQELLVVNLFARISPHPSALQRASDPVGVDNDKVLRACFECWAWDPQMDLWCGWGVSGSRGSRARDVLRALQPWSRQRQIHCPNSQGPLSLALTRTGQPRHPLYAPRQSTLSPFHWAEIGAIRHPESITTD
jgi:hypothetical protein